MGRFSSTTARTGGETVDGYLGIAGTRRLTIREKVNVTAGVNSVPLLQRIPPRSRILYSQLYNAQALGYVGTDAVGTAASTAAANNLALFVSTVSSYVAATAAVTQTSNAGVVGFIGTSTAAKTAAGDTVHFTPLTNGRFDWTFSTPGYIHLFPAANVTSGHVIGLQTGTVGYKFFSTNTAATNTAAVSVQIECETYGDMAA